ncbi:PREDICTED: uncharacterized protein LOC109593755 isoform X2 [Amphimedon queenslandica]|uniref:Uncharacterized protein n=1 Tax=Amphimedon queenslandica TaxID=400682 RepID=A0AAN0K548_AMPQE|nr:PREDICTED: uncharacterized protein LOC109593755 isoform X2 [Amphimedon queenslandica]|eukprot:XP_019864360.1 PREDICTED: uncharacterized protein LOC109593755 isoform X2 [Amphimedon queenslandica]
MHRRTNSYSYTVNSNSVPPPLAALSKKLQQNEEFVRSTLDRRSYKSSNSSLSANKGYKNVTVTLAVPGKVKYSVEDMYRPRSPVKVNHKSGPRGSPGATAGTDTIPELDSLLCDIKEQLSLMKRERNDIADRLSSLSWGIDDTFDELQASITASAASQQQQRSNSSLRRIHSLDSSSSLASYSLTQLPDNIMETAISEADSASMSSVDNSPLLIHKSGTAPDTVSIDSLTNSGIAGSHSPSIVRRNSSLTRKGMSNRLPTIPDRDSAMSFIEGVDGEIERGGESSSDELQVSPSSFQQVSPENSSPKVLFSPKNSKSPKVSSPTGLYYTLPNRHSSTPSSPHNRTPSSRLDASDTGLFCWDKASINSNDSSSMILQISSATVDRQNKDQEYCSLPQSYRLSVSSYYIGPGFEDSDSMIMKLSEEPSVPSRSNSISSVLSSHSARSHKLSTSSRNSVLLNSKETSV